MSVEGNGERRGLVFGIFPGGVVLDAASGAVTEQVDDAAGMMRVRDALDRLQGGDRPFLVRGYTHYVGAGRSINTTPLEMRQYASGRRKLDLTLCYRTQREDLDDWTRYVRRIVAAWGPWLGRLQITEEPTNRDAASGGDGSFAGVRRALVAGVLAASEEVRRRRLPTQVGFSATLSFNPADDFWPELAEMGHPAFWEALDYVGLDFFPGVFRPLPPDASLRDAVSGVLAHSRNVNLAAGKLPASVPIHITEHGWPTGDGRAEVAQAAAVEEVIGAVAAQQKALHITHYTFFHLLDADPARESMQWGLLRHDYSPKPAFEVYRRLIAELSAT